MNIRADSESIVGAIDALIEARADVNLESDGASSPLLVALQYRNVTAMRAMCQGKAKFIPELLDEVKTLSEPTRRREVEEILRPVVRGNKLRQLPLWVWVQDGNLSAVESLLQNSGGEERVDTDALVALQRCNGSEATVQKLAEILRRFAGDSEFERLQALAATRRLLHELREALDDRRSVSIDTVRDTIKLGADVNAEEEDAAGFDEDASGYNLTPLQLLATNTYAVPDSIGEAIVALADAKADVNADANSDSPLLTAVQHRCTPAVEALSKSGVRMTPDLLEELKLVSRTEVRHRIEDFLRPLIARDRSLRCPLWFWVQAGSVMAVEALLRNAAHDEDVDVDVFVALQRCRGDDASKQMINDHVHEHVGDEEYRRLEAAAATRRLLLELRDAHTEERDLDLDIVQDTLSRGANPNATEEALEDDGMEEDEEEQEDGSDSDLEDGEQDDEDDDDDSSEDADDEDDDEDEKESGEEEPSEKSSVPTDPSQSEEPEENEPEEEMDEG